MTRAKKRGASTGPGPMLPVVDEALSAREVAAILQRRAQALARPPAEERAGATAQVVTFTLGQESYAIDADCVENIYPLQDLTPVPCAPDFVIGVVNLRGRIFSVIDLHRFLGLEAISVDEDARIIAVDVAGLELAFLANDVRSVGPLVLDGLEPALPTVLPIAAEYVRGVTPDMVVLLDIKALVRDRRMVVHQEV